MKSLFNLLNADSFGDIDKNLSYIDKIIENWASIFEPLLIFFATFGVIYAIYLGVKLAIAPDNGKRQEAKKHMVAFIVGMAIIIIFLLVLKIFESQAKF